MTVLRPRWRLADDDRLVLRALVHPDPSVAADAISRWTGDVDLDVLADRLHPLAAAVGASIEALGLDVRERQRLVGMYRKAWTTTRQLTHAAAAAAEVTGVPLVAAGGFALAPWWPTPAARPQLDGRLLAAPHQLADAQRALAAAGWRRVGDDRWEPPGPVPTRVLLGPGTAELGVVAAEPLPHLSPTEAMVELVGRTAASLPGGDLTWVVDTACLAPRVEWAEADDRLARRRLRGVARAMVDCAAECTGTAPGGGISRPGLVERLDAMAWGRQYWRRPSRYVGRRGGA